MQLAFREARDAQQLLTNPKIVGFFEGERGRARRELQSLPANAQLSEYQEIKIRLNMLDELEKQLSQYVRHWEDMEQRREWLKENNND